MNPALPWQVRRPPSHAWIVATLASLAATALALLVDRPLAAWVSQWQASPVWSEGLEVLDTVTLDPYWRFSTVAAVMVPLVLAIVPRWRGLAPAAMLVAASHLIAKYATAEIKEWTDRLRPHEWLVYAKHYGAAMPVWGQPGGLSFPSGHVTHYGSLVIPLMMIARTRVAILVGIAIMAFVMTARIALAAHWLSDTLGGISLCLVIATLLGVAVRPWPPR